MLNLNFPGPRDEPADAHRHGDFTTQLNGGPMDMVLPGFQVEDLPEFPLVSGQRAPAGEMPDPGDGDKNASLPPTPPPL